MRADDSGGGGDYSSITFDGMTSLVSDVKSAGTTLQDTTKSLQTQASACSVASPAFNQLITIGDWAEQQVDGLQRRLTLALAMQDQTGSQLSGWTIYEPLSMTTAEAEAKGRDLAQQIKNYNRTDEGGADNLHDVATQLGAYANDPDVLSAFYAEMGDQTIQLGTLLEADNGENKDQDMAAFSRAFAGAMKDPDPPQEFTDLAASFTQPIDGDSGANKYAEWERLAFLQEGDFPAAWLAQVVRANGLQEFSDDGYDTDWRGGGISPSLGLSESNVALMFNALRNNPDAARQAFSGLDLQNMTQNVYGAVEALGTGSVDADAYALAVQSASGTNDESMGSHSYGASQFTMEFIQASGSVEDVPDEMKTALGEIAASYAPELLTGAESFDAASRESSATRPDDFSDIPGIDPAFYLSPEDTYRFLHGFASDDTYSAPFDQAVNGLYDDALVAAAAEKKANPDSSQWTVNLRRFGQLAGLEYTAQRDVRGDMDEADQRMRDLVGTVLGYGLGKVPTPQGLAAQYGWKLTSYVIGKGISAWTKGDPEQTRVALLDDQELQASFLVNYQLAHTLLESGYPGMDRVPPELMDGDQLKSPGDIAADADLIDAYQKWTDGTDTGSQADLDEMLDGGQASFQGGQKWGEDSATNFGWD